MSPHERRTLEEIRREHATCKRLLADALKRNAADADAALASRGLEGTYILRAYAGFESLLRDRTSPSSARASLTTHVNTLLKGRPQTVADPARGYAVQIPWRELFARDRNALAHGRTLTPAMSIDLTINAMQQFLRLL